MPKKAHAIIPWEERVHLTPFHTVSRVQVELDVDDAHKLSGWVDSDGKDSREFMLSKVQIEAIAEAAGIQILESKPLPTQSPEIVVWQVEIAVEGVDGKIKRLRKTYELDMRLKDRDGVDGGYILLARSNARKKMQKAKENPRYNHSKGMPALDAPDSEWDAWVNEQAMGEWTMTNRHRVRRAETGAELAAVRTKCRIKNKYTATDFDIPWEIYRADFDVTRALQAGGMVSEMAHKAIAASMVKSLGLSPDIVEGMIKSLPPGTGAVEQDLLNADDEEIVELEKAMVEAGFKNRSNCDGRAIEIFGLPLSQLTRRHVRLMHEYIDLGKEAVQNIDKDEIKEFIDHVVEIMQIAYATKSTIADEIDQKWWDAAHGIIQGEPPDDEVEESEEETSEEPEEEQEEEPKEEESEGVEGEESAPPSMMDIIGGGK